MESTELSFVELVLGDIRNRNRIVNVKDINKCLLNEIKTPKGVDKEIYTTVCRFTEDVVSYIKQNNSIKGYSGLAYSPVLYLDFDDADIDNALAELRKTIERLAQKWEIPPKQLRYWFSGSKGFHVEIPSIWCGAEASPKFNTYARQFIQELVGDANIDYAIYGSNVKLIRHENSVNFKSFCSKEQTPNGPRDWEWVPIEGKVPRYKVRLSPEEILNGDSLTILQLAEKRRSVIKLDLDPIRKEPRTGLIEMWQRAINWRAPSGTSGKLMTPFNFTRADVPRGEKVCIYTILYQGLKEKRDRDASLLVLVDYFRRVKNYPRQMTEAIMADFLQTKVSGPEPPTLKDVMSMIDRAYAPDYRYDFGCNTPVMKSRCCESRECSFWKIKTAELSGDEAYSLDELIALYDTYAKNPNTNSFTTGWKKIDENLGEMVLGHLCMIIARSGVGKCIAADTQILDPDTGAMLIAREVYRRGHAGEDVKVVTLEKGFQQSITEPSTFVDDGVKPVFRLKTRLGREVKTTLAHPFLTINGWKPLGELQVGQQIAVPRSLGIFGQDRLPNHEIKLLAYLLGDGGLTGCTPRLTISSPEILEETQQCAAKMGLRVVQDSSNNHYATYRLSYGRGRNKVNPLTAQLREWGVWGKTSLQKEIPQVIYRLPKDQLAVFLSRLFSTDGTAYISGMYSRIGYSSSSKKMIQGVQHLLLRFGILSAVREKQVKYNGGYNTAYELDIRTRQDILRFADQIGIFAKQGALDRVVAMASTKKNGGNLDTLPMEVWEQILIAKGNMTWAEITRRTGRSYGWNWCVNKNRPRPSTLEMIAGAIESLELMALAQANIYWDEIVSIEYVGEEQVYDLTVPETHNFVAADFYLHNTAYLQQLMTNIAKKHQQPPTLFYSLEMPLHEVYQRLGAATEKTKSGMEVKVIYRENRSRARYLLEKELKEKIDNIKFIHAGNMTFDRMRDAYYGACKKFSIDNFPIVVVDYMGRMSGQGKDDYHELSFLAKGLKTFATDMNVLTICAAQTGREEGGIGEKPLSLKSARGSGQIEEASDQIIGLYRPKKLDELKYMKTSFDLRVQLIKVRGGTEGYEHQLIYDGPKSIMYEEGSEDPNEAARRADLSDNSSPLDVEAPTNWNSENVEVTSAIEQKEATPKENPVKNATSVDIDIESESQYNDSSVINMLPINTLDNPFGLSTPEATPPTRTTKTVSIIEDKIFNSMDDLD